MELSKNGRSALAFLATGFALAVFDFTTMFANPEWMMALPEWWRDMMPKMINVFSPIIFLAAGIGVAMALRGDRRGWILVILFGVGGLLTSVGATYYRLSDDLIQAAVICAVQLINSTCTIYFASQALQERVTPARSAHPVA